MNEIEHIEKHLRKAPRLNIPRGLREKLQTDIPLPVHAPDRDRSPVAATRNAERWLSREPLLKKWVPALCFSALFLACLVAIAVQSNLLSELRRENESLKTSSPNLDQLRRENLEYQRLRAENQQLERLRKDNAEVQNLLKEVAQLRQQAQEIPVLRSENQRLLAEKKTAESRIPPDAQPEPDPFDAARTKAQKISCINNLKHICLAARMWSNDHNDVFPPDFSSMSNELSSLKLLVCAGDTNRPVALNWAGFGPANVSYEFMSPGAPENDPSVVLFRCPLHNNVGLADGSAHMLESNFKVVQKDGKWVIGKVSPTTE